MCHYNGIDIVQARNYVNIHVETCIDKILKVHGWETASPMEDRLVEPIHPSDVHELEDTDPPPPTLKPNPSTMKRPQDFHTEAPWVNFCTHALLSGLKLGMP